MTRKTRIVPRLVIGASFVAVVPACALVACGGQTTKDAGADVIYGVAAVGFCCFDAMGVADVGFVPDADAHDGMSDAPEGG